MRTIETNDTTMINDVAAEALRLLAAGEDGVQFVLNGSSVHVRPGMTVDDIIGAWLTAKEPIVQTVEVRGKFVRRCSKCKRTEEGVPKAFQWDSNRRAWMVSEHEFPSNWLVVHIPIFYSPTQEYPTHFRALICTECKPAFFDYINFRDPRTEEQRKQVEEQPENWRSL